jgi:hypothetical protein
LAIVRGVDGRVMGECLDDTLEPDEVVCIDINYENASLKMPLERSRLLGNLNSCLMAVVFFIDLTRGFEFRLTLGLDEAGVKVAQAVVGGDREGNLLNLVWAAA